MSSPTRVIIDTDPGTDDVLAMLLAFAASPQEIEILLVSITFGNVDVQNCLRNVVSMFHVIEKEMEWRNANGQSEGFQSLRSYRPLVAVGADGPLEDQLQMAAYFHGADGLGGVHSSHQHLTPPETWKSLFSPPPSDTLLTSTAVNEAHTDPTSPTPFFTPSQRPSHFEILRILEENPPDTISIIAIGPLTNIALAASEAPQTLMRAKNVLVMGGAVERSGNMTPLAEFNAYADTTAAARVFALSSPNPASTMPPPPPPSRSTQGDKGALRSSLPPYPQNQELGPKRLKVILFPLDITTRHTIRRDEFDAKVKPLVSKGSPLAEWTNAWMGATFGKQEVLHHGHEGGGAALDLHDPLCVWYALKGDSQKDEWKILTEDIRVETAGQWTRGMCVVDRRDRKKGTNDDGESGEVPGDLGGWLNPNKGNRIGRCVGTPGERVLAPLLLETIFG